MQGYYTQAYVGAAGVPGGGAGAEIRVLDTQTGEYVTFGVYFIGITPNGKAAKTDWIGTTPYSINIPGPDNPDDPERYEFTGQFRAVCITNWRSVPHYDGQPWTWD
jgi:hypothetical protein